MFLKPWFFLSISSALLIAIAQIFDKLLTRNLPTQVIPAVKKIINGLILLLVLFFLGVPSLTNWLLWKYILLLAVLDFFATLFYFVAIKQEAVSKILPYKTSLVVLITFTGAVILLSEAFTLSKAAGGLLIAVGVYLVLSNGKLKLPEGNKGFVLISMSGLLWAAYELTVKIGVSMAPPILLAILVYFVSGSFFWFYNGIFNRDKVKTLRKSLDLKNTIIFLVACIGASFSLLALYLALSMGPASLVLPLAHTAPLFLVVFSGKILKENNTVIRFLGSATIVIGIILLYLS